MDHQGPLRRLGPLPLQALPLPQGHLPCQASITGVSHLITAIMDLDIASLLFPFPLLPHLTFSTSPSGLPMDRLIALIGLPLSGPAPLTNIRMRMVITVNDGARFLVNPPLR